MSHAPVTLSMSKAIENTPGFLPKKLTEERAKIIVYLPLSALKTQEAGRTRKKGALLLGHAPIEARPGLGTVSCLTTDTLLLRFLGPGLQKPLQS